MSSDRPAMIGSILGPYEITGKLGEGGMGEVYRATDSKLRRDVAIKVLPKAFAEDAERLSRFEREAQLLAQLQHQNIASIYGLEESDGLQALVMELVEGPTLDERLSQGPMPLDEVLDVARQIAEALEEAHDKGIIHRDLKPQNVKQTPGGQVKVLDFGLAKAMDPTATASGAESASRLAASPTLTLGATAHGVILGTAGYMSPEQAKGLAVDKRSDIWAFGVLLYEMLTGARLFAGSSVPETLAEVLKSDIDLSTLPASTPPAIRRLLRRCLERTPRDRLHDIADARIEIRDAIEGTVEAELPGAPPPSRRIAGWQLPLVAMLLLALGLAAGFFARPGSEPPPLVRAEISAPEGMELVPIGDAAGPITVSPDGRQLAFTARDVDGVTRLYVRSLAASEARVIPGSEGARYPFWSPDGRSLGFFDTTRLLRVDIAEGVPQPLAPIDSARGGSWGADGIIVYSPSYDRALLQIPSNGGQPIPASELDEGRLEGTHRFPSFLPDGRHFLFEVRGYNAWMRAQDGVFVGSVDDPTQRLQLLPFASNAAYASGWLLFVRQGALCAQRFDLERLELSGPVAILLRDIRFDRRYSLGAFSVAAGVLALQPAGKQDASELVWLDRMGRRLERVAEAAYYDGVDLSPDASQAVLSVVDPETLRSHLEIVDLERNSSTRLTLGEADDYGPIFSPDAQHVLFARVDDEGIGLWIKRVDGSEAEQLIRPPSDAELLGPLSWSPDGRELLVSSFPGGSLPTGFWTLPASGEGELERYTDSRANGDIGLFSPDGRWVLFDANDGNGFQTYLARFPDTGGRWQLGVDSAIYSRWSRHGSEIVYATGTSQLTALPVDLEGSSPRFGKPQSLFTLPELSIAGEYFDVAPDGERILALLPVADARPVPYTVILNWEQLLETAP